MGSVGGWEKQFPEVASFFSFHPNWTRLGILPEIEITHQWRRLTFTPALLMPAEAPEGVRKYGGLAQLGQGVVMWTPFRRNL